MAKRSDANQALIVALIRAAGYSWLDLHELGGGAPDGLVGIPAGREQPARNELVEIKSMAGRVRPGQELWHRTWRGRPVLVIRSLEEAWQKLSIPAQPIPAIARSVAQSGRRASRRSLPP